MNKEKLIEEVRKYNFLYDVNDPKYSDATKKVKAWKQISETLSVPGATCKRTWLNLREAHRRAIKKKTRKVGYRKWQYEDEMSFLLPHYKERTTITSISRDSDLESLDNDDSQMYTPDHQSDTSVYQEISVIDDRLQPEASTTSTKMINFSKRPKRLQEEGSSTSSLLMEYILEEKRKTKEEDDIDKFFSGIISTVKKFNAYSKAMVKSQIFSIVSQMELQELAENRNYHCSNCNYSSAGSSEFPDTSNYESQKNIGDQNLPQEFVSKQENCFDS